MKEQWRQARLRVATVARLKEFISKLELATGTGQLVAPCRYDRNWTLDDAINVLLDRDARKRERVAKSKAKSRTTKSVVRPDDQVVEV